MAVELTPTARFTRAGVSGANQTQGGWFRLDAVPAAYRCIYALDDGPDDWMGLYLDEDSGNARLNLWNNSTTTPNVSGPLITLGEWYYVAAVRAGTGWTLWWRHQDDLSLSSATGSVAGTISANNLRVGAESAIDSGTTLDGSLGYWRVFESALAESAVMDESESATAIAVEWADWPLENTTNSTDDASGNARPLTFTAGSGAQANTDDPLNGGATEVQGTAAATWGPWSGTAAGDVEAGVTEGLAEATWGPWTATASGQITEAVTSGTAAATWGPWSGTADGQVITDIVGGTASATWGPWAGTALGEVTETKVDITVSVGVTRGRRGIAGKTRTGWTVGATRIDRGA